MPESVVWISDFGKSKVYLDSAMVDKLKKHFQFPSSGSREKHCGFISQFSLMLTMQAVQKRYYPLSYSMFHSFANKKMLKSLKSFGIRTERIRSERLQKLSYPEKRISSHH